MWNFGIPSSLKAWIDHVVRAGKTFNYVGGAVEGLAKGKKAILVLASRGIFSEGALEIMGFRAAVSAPDSGLHWNWMTSRPYGPGMNIPPLAIHAVSNGEKAVEALVIQRERTMLDHIILTVSNVERSLALYEAALKPLHIKFFLPTRAKTIILICGDLVMARERSSGSNKGSMIQRPFTGGSWPKTMVRSMNSTGQQHPLVPGAIFHRGHEWNTIRDTTPPMYLTRTGIRSKSSIKPSEEPHIAKVLKARQQWLPTVQRALSASAI